jgi:hypothetical protein
MGAGEVVVLAKNRDLFQSRYGTSVLVFGEYAGGLSSDGERVRLLDASGGVITQFTYDDAPPWPAVADGSGPSLQIIDLQGTPDSGSNWRVSPTAGGDPGVVGSSSNPADFDGDGDADGNDFLRWQRGVGKPSATKADGDANSDSIVNGLDLAIWKDEFGATIASAQAAVIATGAELAAAARGPNDSRATELVDLAMAQDLGQHPSANRHHHVVPRKSGATAPRSFFASSPYREQQRSSTTSAFQWSRGDELRRLREMESGAVDDVMFDEVIWHYIQWKSFSS